MANLRHFAQKKRKETILPQIPFFWGEKNRQKEEEKKFEKILRKSPQLPTT
jgi:hypothetical protein